MKPAVFLYGVPGQYGNYAAALEAAGARVVLCRDLYRSLDCDGLLLPGGGVRCRERRPSWWIPLSGPGGPSWAFAGECRR